MEAGLLWMILSLVSGGLLFDHYFLLPNRMTERFIKQCEETGHCVICGRPIELLEDEE